MIAFSIGDKCILAGIFRNIAEQCIAKETLERRFDEYFENGKKWNQGEINNLKSEVERLRKEISIFEAASGVKIDEWGNNKNIGEAVRIVLDGRDREAKENLTNLLRRARNIVKFLEGENISIWDRS